jgi:hypothetical protein
VKVIVPGLQDGEGVLEELLRVGFVLGVSEDIESGRSVKGRLDHT